MVGALQRLPASLPVAEDEAPVPADVDEPAEGRVLAAHEHDGQEPRDGRRELPRLGDLVEACGVLPEAPEEPLLLQRRELGVDVPGVRERARAGGGRHAGSLEASGSCLTRRSGSYRESLLAQVRQVHRASRSQVRDD